MEAFERAENRQSDKADVRFVDTGPQTQADRVLQAKAEAAGFELVQVQGRAADGRVTPLDLPGTIDTKNPRRLIVEAGNSDQTARGIAYHELFGHAVKRTDPRTWRDLTKRLAADSPGELRTSLEEYLADFDTATESPQGTAASRLSRKRKWK